MISCPLQFVKKPVQNEIRLIQSEGSSRPPRIEPNALEALLYKDSGK